MPAAYLSSVDSYGLSALLAYQLIALPTFSQLVKMFFPVGVKDNNLIFILVIDGFVHGDLQIACLKLVPLATVTDILTPEGTPD